MALIDVRFYDFLGKALRPNPPSVIRGIIPDNTSLIALANKTFIQELHLRFPNLPNVLGSKLNEQAETLRRYYGDLIEHNRPPLNFLNNPGLASRQYELPEKFYRELDPNVLKWMQTGSSAPPIPTLTKPTTIPILQSQAEAAHKAPIQSGQAAPTSTHPATPAHPQPASTSTTPQTTKVSPGQQPKAAGQRGFNIPRGKLPYALSNAARTFGSNAGIFLKKNIARIASGLSGLAGGLFGAGGNFAKGGVGALGNLGLRAGGLGLRGFDASANALQRAGNARARLGSQLRNARNSRFFKGSRAAWLLLAGIFLFMFGAGFMAGINPSEQLTLPGTPLVPSINSCQFTRSDQNPRATSYRSPMLLGYFQQASQVTSVPAQILAAVARVESPSSTSKTDADLPSLSSITGCPRSQTGALGIMQLQPPGTRGYIETAIAQGASYLGKTVDQLTENDFCDLRSNIIMAGGFITKKLQIAYGLGNGAKWEPSWTNSRDVIYKLATAYYGCLEYGGSDPLKCEGPYNYGDDIWASTQGCQTSTITPGALVSCPVPGGSISTHSYQVDPNRGHCSSGYLSEGRCREDCPGGVGNSRRAKAIDVPTHGQDVTLPTIDGQSVNWLFKLAYTIELIDGGGAGFVFEARNTTDGRPLPHVWTLDMLHMATTGLNLHGTYPSSTHVGQTAIDHVHFTIGKDIRDNTQPGPNTTVTDCDPGWVPSDFACQ